MPTVLITGASRGIGLEFASQYAQDGWRVHATERDPQAAQAPSRGRSAPPHLGRAQAPKFEPGQQARQIAGDKAGMSLADFPQTWVG